jgi:hypothetical protein
MPKCRRFAMACLGLHVIAASLSPVHLRADEPPGDSLGHTLKNGQVQLDVLLPNATQGYYRGTRFDWSGLIRQARYQGHTFFGEWKTPHDPTNHDDVVGPAEEFGMDAPLGYAEARPGEPFLKIGVGLLEKVDEPKYRFWHPYRLLRPGGWEISKGDDWIEFRQDMDGPRGWGYRYTKRIALEGNGPSFTIEHQMKNTGSKRIDTTHYCHNFFIIDGQPVGTAYRLAFPFAVDSKQPLGEAAVIEGRDILFRRDLKPGEALFAELRGYRGVEDNEVVIENRKAGAAVKIAGDRAPLKVNLYAVNTAICPEPFVTLTIEPGGGTAWKNRYTLIQVDK